MNMGKDFSRDTVEMSGRTDPGAFIAFSGVDYDWYSHGADIFLREKDVRYISTLVPPGSYMSK